MLNRFLKRLLYRQVADEGHSAKTHITKYQLAAFQESAGYQVMRHDLISRADSAYTGFENSGDRATFIARMSLIEELLAPEYLSGYVGEKEQLSELGNVLAVYDRLTKETKGELTND